MADEKEIYDYIESTGTVVVDTSSIKEEVQKEFKGAFGDDLVLTPSTPQGRWIEVETTARTKVVKNNSLIANQLNPDLSEGIFTDAICALFGLERVGATSSRVLATVSGTPGTIVQQGARAATINDDMFYNENEFTIPETGNINAYFVSVDKGAIPCGIGELINIEDGTLGWETINNSNPAELGSDYEDERPLKTRRKKSLFNGVSLLRDTEAALYAVPNIKSHFVKDNPEAYEVIYQGITLRRNSIVVIADGGKDEDIIDAIFKKKSGGCGYTAIPNLSVTVEIPNGAYNIPYPVTFNRPEYIKIKVKLEIERNLSKDTNLEQTVKDALINWENGNVESVEGLKLDIDVSPFEIASAISVQIPEIRIKKVSISVNDSDFTTDELEIKFYQCAQILSEDIEVIIS